MVGRVAGGFEWLGQRPGGGEAAAPEGGPAAGCARRSTRPGFMTGVKVAFIGWSSTQNRTAVPFSNSKNATVTQEYIGDLSLGLFSRDEGILKHFNNLDICRVFRELKRVHKHPSAFFLVSIFEGKAEQSSMVKIGLPF